MTEYTITNDLWAACRWIDAIKGGRAVLVDDHIVFGICGNSYYDTHYYGGIENAFVGQILIVDDSGNVFNKPKLGSEVLIR